MNKQIYPLHGLEYVQGEPVDLAASKGKHVVVLEFWATWCPPCRNSIPHLSQIYQKYKNLGVIFLGITNESADKARKFVQQMGAQMSYTVAADPSQQVYSSYMRGYGFEGIPAAIVIDRSGVPIWTGHPMEPAMESAIDRASKQPQFDVMALSVDELRALKPSQLKQILQEHRVDFSDCIEKSELVNRILQQVQKKEIQPSNL